MSKESKKQFDELEQLILKSVKKPDLAKQILLEIRVFGSLRWNEGVHDADYEG